MKEVVVEHNQAGLHSGAKKSSAKPKKSLTSDTKTALANLSRLVESAALLIVAVFAIYGAYNYQLDQFVKYVLIVAGVIIGLRGMWELLAHLAEKDRS